MFKHLSYWYPVGLWMGIIFVMSSFQAVSSSEFYWTDFVIKKIAHIIEYGILWWLIYRAFRKSGKMKLKSIKWISLVITIIYAASDELHQTLIPTREGRLRDVLIDTGGALIAMGIVWYRGKKNSG